ncbi:MAG: hypothetical protein AABX72_04465 [Nanoarchaeota archaeon]
MLQALDFHSLDEHLQAQLSLFDLQHHLLEGKVACEMPCLSCQQPSLYIHTTLIENKTSHDIGYKSKEYCASCFRTSSDSGELHHAEVLDLYREVAEYQEAA